MKDPTYYNGIITPYDAAAIPLSDRSVFFGDAVYEVMIGRGTKVYQFEEHLSRLRKNCDHISLKFDISDAEMLVIINELIYLLERNEFSVYVQVSANSERRTHLRTSSTSNLLIFVTEANIPKSPNSIKAIICPDTRYEHCDVKTVNLLPAILAMEEAKSKNADIAIFAKDGIVTECSHANLFILKNDILVTPPLSKKNLPGITRQTLLTQCKKNGVPHTEKEISLSDLFSADAILATSTTKLLQICVRADEKDFECVVSARANELFHMLRSDFLLRTN